MPRSPAIILALTDEYAGEKLYIVASGDILIVRKLPQNPTRQLSKLLGDFKFDREARRKAEEWLLRETKKLQEKS